METIIVSKRKLFYFIFAFFDAAAFASSHLHLLANLAAADLSDGTGSHQALADFANLVGSHLSSFIGHDGLVKNLVRKDHFLL